jgi:hypothetical protein
MTRTIAEWLWRAAVICGLVWIGWELHTLHADIMAPVDEATTAEADPGEVQASLDEIRDALAGLTQKVDAILVVMARAK